MVALVHEGELSRAVARAQALDLAAPVTAVASTVGLPSVPSTSDVLLEWPY